MIGRRWDVSCEENFVEAVLDTYISLPQTPDGVSKEDRRFVYELYREGYGLYNIEAALLLGSIRRIFSNPHSYRPKVSSLKEFRNYIEELRNEPLQADYARYLRHLLSPVLRLESEPSQKE